MANRKQPSYFRREDEDNNQERTLTIKKSIKKTYYGLFTFLFILAVVIGALGAYFYCKSQPVTKSYFMLTGDKIVYVNKAENYDTEMNSYILMEEDVIITDSVEVVGLDSLSAGAGTYYIYYNVVKGPFKGSSLCRVVIVRGN